MFVTLISIFYIAALNLSKVLGIRVRRNTEIKFKKKNGLLFFKMKIPWKEMNGSLTETRNHSFFSPNCDYRVVNVFEGLLRVVYLKISIQRTK